MSLLAAWRFLTSKIGMIVVAVAGAALFILRLMHLVKKAADQENEIEKLEADKATAERIDNARPAKTADDARDNLAGWLRKPRK